jgi:erythronate-4-phosphate dehydrogenase
MKILYDENMPFANEFFSEFGELVSFAGREVTPEHVADADVLLVRSITSVNETLLAKNSSLKFVGTATIGVDHIDQAYLKEKNINFSSAPGCNAVSVAEYVLSSLVIMCERYQKELTSLTVGIVGAGNTGTRVSEKLDALGIKYLLCDPLLEQSTTDKRRFASLSEIIKCDVISLHVPLTFIQDSATYHLFNEALLTQLNTEQILINACRGEVVDNTALLQLKMHNQGPKLVWDVWENEPEILYPLVEYTDIATAHIAGYSLEGKSRGTEMLYQALCKQLNMPVLRQLSEFLPESDVEYISVAKHSAANVRDKLIKLVYDVRRDDAIFRQQIKNKGFDFIRKTYPARREFSSLKVEIKQPSQAHSLYQLGFSKP